jgi:hypothetical protein
MKRPVLTSRITRTAIYIKKLSSDQGAFKTGPVCHAAISLFYFFALINNVAMVKIDQKLSLSP